MPPRDGQGIGEATPERSRKGHVTAVDLADADMIVDVVNALATDPTGDWDRVAKNTIAKLLADKREEWIACAMVRVEREFKVTRRSLVRGPATRGQKETTK